MSGGTGSPPGDGEPTGDSDSDANSDAPGGTEPATGNETRESDRASVWRDALPTAPDRLGRWWRFTKRLLVAHFGIDARALAAFRVGLGAVMVLNLVLRARFIDTFYTDWGLYPRSVMGDLYPMAETLSIHGQFGGAGPQIALFAVAVVAAVALLVGYRSSLAAVVTLALLFSLHGRNPLVLNGGDILLRHLLFWAILLPVGERWSVDARRRSRAPRGRIATIATAGLLLQVFVVYAMNAVLKSRGDTWHDGTATQYVFQLDQFTVLLGDYVAELTPLVTAFGFTWYWLVTLSLLLIVMRGWPRAIFASMFVGAHVSMALTMQLGVFPIVSIVSLLVFYPKQVWDRVERHVARPLERHADRAMARLSGYRGRPGLPRPSWWPRVVGGWRSVVVPGVAAIAVFAMVVSNVGAVTTADMGPVEVTDLTQDSPRWTMFAPNPLREAVWYTMAGTTRSGERVDAFRGGNVSYDRPPDMADTYPTARWRKYFSYVDSHFGADELQAGLAGHLCRRWNADHDRRLANVTITKHAVVIDVGGNDTLNRDTLGTYDCDLGPGGTARAATTD